MGNKHHNIPKGWRLIDLGEFVSEISQRHGNNASNEKAVLSVTNKPGFVVSEDFFERKVFSKDLANYKVIHQGQFAYNPSRVNVGSIARLKECKAGLLSPMYIVFETKDGLEREYLDYWIQSQRFRNLVKASTQGTVRDSLNFSALEEFPFLLPPLLEQKKIISILSAVDSAISATQAVIDQAQLLKKGLMQELFTRGIPGRHKRFKKTEIGLVPEEWEVVEIGDVFELKSGTTPDRKNTDYYENGKVHWVKTTDLNDAIILNTEEKITQKAVQETSCPIYPKETILIAMYGGFNQIGRTGILVIEAATNQAITALLPNKNFDSRFVNFILIFLRNRWKRFASSSRKDPNITKNDIKKFKIPAPLLEEQREIARVVSFIINKIEIATIILNKFDTLKSALMQVLLSGKVRIKT